MKTGYIMLLTPYLSENPEAFGARKKVQKERYGLEDRNLSDERVINTGDFQISLAKPFYSGTSREKISFRGNLQDSPLLTIAGCTVPGEEEVRQLRDTGLVVARFSIFYGGRSGYTGFLPEESGYSIDLPKRVDTVRALLSDERVLEGLVERDSEKIREAIDLLNRNLSEPVLLTNYLEQALEVGKKAEEILA